MGKTEAPGLRGRRKKTGGGPGKGRRGVTSLWQQGRALLAAGDRRDGGRQQAEQRKPAQRKVSA